MSIAKKLDKAQIEIITTQPFFASILLSMPLIEEKDIETLETNGEYIKYNPDFIGSLTDAETTFVLAHETMHAVFEHSYTRGDRDPQRWNIAADYVINDLLVKEKIGTMPKCGLYDPALVQAGGGTTEGVYKLLPESKPKQKQDGKNGKPQGTGLDNVVDGGKDEAERAQKQADIQVKVTAARNAAKMSGQLSADLARIIDEVMKPRTDWKAILRRFLTERSKTEISYARPKRRFLAEDLYLPSITGEKLSQIVVAVDCSGSIDNVILGFFEREIQAIVEDIKPESVKVIYFDAKVLHEETFTPDDIVKLKPRGGGGTAFSPIFRAIATQETPPTACVVLTDLYCSDFGPQPEYPVLWASYGSQSAPWGEIVELKEGE